MATQKRGPAGRRQKAGPGRGRILVLHGPNLNLLGYDFALAYALARLRG